MTALALLKSTIIERKSPRYIFRRRAVITTGPTAILVKTLDVSEQGFGVVAAEPVIIGRTCSLILNALVGDRIVQQTFSCEIVYCILSGVDGFRIGLSINDATVDSPKQRLQKIIASCSPSFAS
ncbi:MAG: PilZ domain-containing protein [Herminiimonas sp.]|uniref:PilZ domain-containing protein n=1 Tax=Herminiimonas sp. TaxID=1926289 RepID=UPI00271CA328|nr:PilZ domain-containing protein [Herminiimonas sp.]MDO9420959.1 PilZ domain-containing protein [Herminiimonas sp.]